MFTYYFVVAFHQYIICAFVFIVVCLHSAGLALNVLSSGLAFNVLLLHSNHALAAKYCILLVSLLLLSLLSLLCIICAVVFIVVIVECLHSAGLASNVLSSGLAFNVLLLLLHFTNT